MGCSGSRPQRRRNNNMSWDPTTTVIRVIQQQQSHRKQRPVLTPDHSRFTAHANGGRGYTVTDVYEPAGVALGSGNFGNVYRARHKMADPHRPRPWNKVAIKVTAPTVLDTRAGPLQTYQDLIKNCNEIKALLRLQLQPHNSNKNGQQRQSDSPVLMLYEFFWTYQGGDGRSQRNAVGELVLVTEHLGLDLDQWLRQQRESQMFESIAREITRTLVRALDYIHQRKVVHRDMKLQNVMFRRNGDYKTLKVIDFGLAHVMEDDQVQLPHVICGSKGYIAPEIYRGQPYGYEVDMFALGVMVFRLLSGSRPFLARNDDKLKADTIGLRYTITGNVWNGVSTQAVKFVRKLLIGRDERLTAPQAVQHEWFRSREESVLYTDYSNFAPVGSYSRAMVQTHIPAAQDGSLQAVGGTTTTTTTTEATTMVKRFWLDDRLHVPINILKIYNLYAGRIVNDNNNGNGQQQEHQQGDNLIMLEEVADRSLQPLPNYLARLTQYTERECRHICRQAAMIVQILHSNKMAHRNIHLGNFVVDATNKLLVRGLSNAQAAEDGQPLTGHFGLMHEWYAFMAPEIDSDFFHDKAVDLWSLGAFIYMMLTGLPPFRGNRKVLMLNKHNGNVVFDAVVPSSSARSLVRALLQVNPADRPTIEEVLDAEWMIESDDVLAGLDLSLATTFMSDWPQLR